jgi:hypothetical protein
LVDALEDFLPPFGVLLGLLLTIVTVETLVPEVQFLHQTTSTL